MSSPSVRLEIFIEIKGLSVSDVAKAIGMTYSNFKKYLGEGKSTLGEKFRKSLKELFGLNIAWYLTGEGEMTIPTANIPVINGHKGVPYYPIDVTASIVRSFDDVPVEPDFYIDYRPFNDCTACFPVYGESMYPLFNSGDVIACKKLTNIDIILWGEPHFVITDENANNLKTVKLLYPCDEDNNLIVLRASNPEYKGDTVISKESILNLFIIKGKISQRML